MITNNGVEIISKYLAGQASSYASHIAIGTGARPLSNSQKVVIAPSGTLSYIGVSGGVHYATITTTQTVPYIEIGDLITATAGSPGTLGAGVVTVSDISVGNNPKVFQVQSTAIMTSGTITQISVSTNLLSKTLSNQTELNFEIDRFPITSRAYVVDKQTVKCSSMFISGSDRVTVVVSTAPQVFGVGDVVFITDVDYQSTGPVSDTQVNGMYTIVSTSSTGFIAKQYDDTLGTWDSSLFNVNYTGFASNASLFNATVYTKQLSLTAEIADSNQYDITELGLYSLGSNQLSNSASDSKTLLTFSSDEDWKYFNNLTNETPDVSYLTPMASTLNMTVPTFVSANDAYWTTVSSDTYRILRQEKPRIYVDALIMPGNTSEFVSGTTFTTASKYVIKTSSITLDKASSADELSLAFSIANATANPTVAPTSFHIMIEFLCRNGTDSAKMLFDQSLLTDVIPANRYIVLDKALSTLSTTAFFTWGAVTSVKVYSSIEVSGTPTNQFAIVLDALRFKSVSVENPLYALTAYTIVNNSTALPIYKKANSSELVNFRIDLQIGQ